MPGADVLPPFVGFLTIRCSAVSCDCYVTGLFGAETEAQAWGQMRAYVTEYGWVCTPWARDDGPHFCPCQHPEARDAR